MDRIIKIMITLIFVMTLLLFLPDLLNKTEVEEIEKEQEIVSKNTTKRESEIDEAEELDYWVNDSVYIWDEAKVNWIATGVYKEPWTSLLPNEGFIPKEPIKLSWDLLLDIQYRLRYFQSIQTDMFSPVFGDEVQKLDGKEVIIEGFVIPFDEEGELLALSYNPYSSCFFCGQASPASVISMYMKNKGKLYDIDDFKRFKGTLFLNHDDPDQFYYILKNVIEL